MKQFFIGRCFIILAFCAIYGTTAQAGTFNWKANTTGDWSVAGNWVEGFVPTNGDDAVITNAGASAILSSSSSNMASITLSKTLTFTNWNTILTATNITILANGVMTLPNAFSNSGMSNNIYIVCSNLTVAGGGSIAASARGYRGGNGGWDAGQGPGAGAGGYGGGYGGIGGHANNTYGLANAPLQPGSGGGGGNAGVPGGAGGGFVRIEATGAVTVDGTIAANGGNGSIAYGGGGSGGGISITCNTFGGSNGAVTVNGGNGDPGNGAAGSGGGGGRIAVLYNPAAQSAAPAPSVTFSANGGSALFGNGYIGTVYYPDTRILDTSFTTHQNCQLLVAGAAWSPSTLMISNTWIKFPQDGFALMVSTNMTVQGSSGKLEVGGAAYVAAAERFYTNSTNGPTIRVGQNLVVTNQGSLHIYAGLTNAATTNYGALVGVTNDVLIYTNSWIYPYSHPINGGSVLFRARDLTIATPNSGVNADSLGYYSPGAGYGPGGGLAFGSGAGYGGIGGYNGGTNYGSSNAPIHCGSAGYAYHPSTICKGGGLIRIEAAGTVTVEGKITANGGSGGGSTYDGGGAGGGIYVSARRFMGATGSLTANGGNGSTTAPRGGGGGGGRIAIWSISRAFTGSASVTNGAGEAPAATVGTLVWGQLPSPSGTIIVVR